METIDRYFDPPSQSFFLLGPRGTGKSTWARSRYAKALWFDLLDPELFRTFQAHPEKLRDLVRGDPGRSTVVIDEIQKVPALLDVVHQLLESNRPPTFVLTGSSARKLKRTGVDLLAGRAILCSMHPFMACELGPRFDLAEALKTGLVPVVLDAREPGEVLRSYVSLYLREEVMFEGLVRNIGSFSRFLEAVSFSHAAVLNISNVSRECQVGRKTVEGYVEILEDLLLARRLPVFRRRARRATTSHPKLFLFDAGVFRSLRPAGPLDRPEEIEGAALEGLVAQHLFAWNGYQRDRFELAHWRTRGGSEVDFIVYGSAGFWAIEVKNTRSIRPEDLRGLNAFGEDYPQAQRILLYRGHDRLDRDGILCLPCEELLRQLEPGKPVFPSSSLTS